MRSGVSSSGAAHRRRRPRLAGGYSLVTGSGKHFRNVTIEPEGCRHLAKDSRVELPEWFFKKQ